MNEWKTPYNLSTTMWNNCLFTLKPYGTFSVIYNEDEKKLEAHDWTGNRAPVCLLHSLKYRLYSGCCSI